MNDNGAPARDAAANSPADQVTGEDGRRATWGELDETLEVRGRIVAVVDELDAGDTATALLNLRALLEDLDGAAV
jgi:hypothetical protein